MVRHMNFIICPNVLEVEITCIGIRLAYKKNGKVFVRSGAGIVADSIPEKEFQECINKAKAVVEAIKKAQQMAAYEEKENDDDTID